MIRTKTDFPIIVCFILFFLSVTFESRAFSIGVLMALWVVFLIKYPLYKNKIIIYGAIFIGLTLYLCICYLKVGSSQGRMLIYKVSFNILKDNFFRGVGLSNFNLVYMKYQALYFSQGINTSDEFLLADNVFYAYNDYFQFIIETGLVGLLLLIIYFIGIAKIFLTIFKHPNHHSCSIVLCLLFFVIVSVSAFFTFVFSNIVCQLIYLISFLYILKVFFKIINLNYRCILIYLAIATALFSIEALRYLSRFEAEKFVFQQKQIIDAGFKSEGLHNLEQSYFRLKTNNDYLYFYGTELLNNNQYEQAIIELEHVKECSTFNDLYLKLGKCYFLSGDLIKAEYSFIESVNMVPNRFFNRFELYKFYKATHQISKAKLVRNNILNLPIKIKSQEIYFIKEKLLNDKL